MLKLFQGAQDVWSLSIKWANIYQIIGNQYFLLEYAEAGTWLILGILMCVMFVMAHQNLHQRNIEPLPVHHGIENGQNICQTSVPFMHKMRFPGPGMSGRRGSGGMDELLRNLIIKKWKITK